MAVTQNSYLGDGSTTTYPFTFPYLKKSEIKVSLDATVTTAFTTPTATTVQLNTAPASGVKIKIYRETDSDSLSATFYAGSAIKSEDLNDNFTQNLHATQEVTERYLSNLGGNMVGDLILAEDVAIKFEGATDDAYETTLTVTDPTADRTITLPNETGTVITSASTGQVGTGLIANDAINGDKIADNAINSEHYTDGSIDRVHLAADIIDGTKIENDAIDSAHVAADSLDSEHYAPGSVDTTALANDAVTNAKIADDQIDSEHYVDGSIDTAHIANDAVNADKLANTAVTAGSYTAADLTVDAQGRITAASSGSIGTGEIANDAVDGTKIADNAINSEHYVDGSIDHAHLANDIIDGDNIQDDVINSEHIAAGALDNEHYASGSIDSSKLSAATVVTNSEQASASANDTSFFTTSASDARYFNVSTGDTIKDGQTFPDNDTTIATTAAINDRILDLVDNVGGFVPIANETSFPTANPDPENGTGTIVSIQALASNLTSNSSGVATIANGAGSGVTVTINGLANSTTYAATFGMLVETTTTTHTYKFHRQVPKATEVTTVAGSVSNVNTVAGAISNVNTVANNNTNINTVAGINANVTTVAGISSNVTSVAGNSTNINAVNSNSTNINTVAGANSNITSVANSIANVNTVATNISNVNDFSDKYRVASSAPTSGLDTGDLYFDTTGNELKVYNGSAWQGGVTATGNLLSKSGDQMTGNLTFSGTQTVDGRDVSVDGAKLDGIASGAEVNVQSDWNATSGDAQILNKPSVGDGGFTQNNFTNTLKGKLDGIATSANNYTHPNHSGEVTSSADGAQTIASNVVDEDNLKISNSGSNGQFLQKQSGDTGGLTWATPTNTTYSVGDGGLTQKNFTTTLKDKLDGIASGAEVNVQSDWNASSGDAQILNKPTIAPTITGTVSGSISANAPTSIKSDGTLEETTRTTTLLSTPTGVKTFSVSKTAANADTQTNYTTWAYDSDNNKLINFWWSSDKSTLSFQANEVSANGQSITRLGTTESSDALYTSVSEVSTSAVYHPSSKRVLLSYLSDSGGDYGGNWVVRICDFSSGAGTMGSEITIDSNYHSVANSTSSTFCTLAGDKVIIAAEGNFGSPTITAYVCSIDSSGNFSKGSAQTIVSGASSLFSWAMDYDSTNSRLVTAYSYYNSGGYKTYTKISTISGTSITTGSETQIDTTFWRSPSLEHNPDDGKMYFIYQDGNSQLEARVGIVASSGNSITMHSAVSAGSGSTYQPKQGDGVEYIKSKYHPVLKEVCFYWVNNSNASYAGTVTSNSSNVTSFTTSTAYNLLGEAANSARSNDSIVFIAYHSESERMIGFSTRDSDKYQAFVSTNHGSSTTNYDKFVGFASAGYTNGQTATINVAGNTTTQSSLTPGTTYYIQDDGSLGTSPGTINIVGGVALTSTKLLIEGSSLTSLNASDLGSGTLPDARFPETLPAASGANLTSLPAANLTGTLPAISGANLTNLPASGGSITATASGSIANGAAVYKKSDGTVSAIATSTKMLSKIERSEITNWIDPSECNAGANQHYLDSAAVEYDSTTKCVIAVWSGNEQNNTLTTYDKSIWSNVGVVSGSGKDCKIDWGSPQVISAFSSTSLHAWSPNAASIGGGKVVIGWKDRTNNNLKAVVATISATNKNVTLGSVVTESNETWGTDNEGKWIKSLGTDKFIMGAGTGGQWNRTNPKFFIGTVSGTAITLQSRSSSAGAHGMSSWDVNTDGDKIFISAEEVSGSNYWPTFCAGSISGNSITFGSFTRFTGTASGTSTRYYALPVVWDNTNGRLVCYFRSTYSTTIDSISSANRFRTLTMTVSGTTLTVDSAWQEYGAQTRYHSDSTPQQATQHYTVGKSGIYDPNLGGIFQVTNIASEKLQTPLHDVDDVDPYEIAIHYMFAGRSLTGNGSTYTATNDYSLGSPLTTEWIRNRYHHSHPYGHNGVQCNSMGMCYDTDNKQIIFVGTGIWNQNENEDRTSSAWAIAIKTFKPTTTASDFIGFAEAAYTNGQTATITTAGGTNESQSGLTVGSSYYLQGNGTLSTTPDTTYGSIFAGIATAATKLVVSQNNKVNLTGVVTSDGDGITEFADKSITSRKLKTGNYPYKRGLILTTGGYSENQGDEASDRNDTTANKRIYEPSSLVWATPDWELVSYGDDLAISGGSKAIYTRMMDIDLDYGGTSDREVGEVWPSHRFYKVVYESITGTGSSGGDLRLQLGSWGTTLTTSNVSGSTQGAYYYSFQEGQSSGFTGWKYTNMEYIRLHSTGSNFHSGVVQFPAPKYSDRYWGCHWIGQSGHTYNTSSNSSGSNYYRNSNQFSQVQGAGGLNVRGTSYCDYTSIILSTHNSGGFTSLTYRVYGMK